MSVDRNSGGIFSSPDVSAFVPLLVTGVGTLLGVIIVMELMLVRVFAFPSPDGYVAGVITSLPAIVGLIYGGYWLSRNTISPNQYRYLATWWLLGIVVFTPTIVVIAAISDSFGVVGYLSTIRWGASIGGGIGFLIGVFNARAISRAYEAGEAMAQQKKTERQNDLLEDFASVVSHDLRNPLRVAEGSLLLAGEECESEHLDVVARSLDRMLSLIEDMLSLAKAGETVRNPQAVELSTLVESSWQNVETESVRLITETAATIQADETRLQQLLENLFRNAIEHGGNVVTVTVGDLPNGFYLEDDGSGIPEDEREHVFQPRYTTNVEGTGFGLGITKDIAEAHGWTIGLTDASDGGTRFEFTGVQIE